MRIPICFKDLFIKKIRNVNTLYKIYKIYVRLIRYIRLFSKKKKKYWVNNWKTLHLRDPATICKNWSGGGNVRERISSRIISRAMKDRPIYAPDNRFPLSWKTRWHGHVHTASRVHRSPSGGGIQTRDVMKTLG